MENKQTLTKTRKIIQNNILNNLAQYFICVKYWARLFKRGKKI